MSLAALPSGSRSSSARTNPASPRAVTLLEARNCLRVNIIAISQSHDLMTVFAPPFLCNGGVILLEQLVILGHELLARILVHFLTQGLGQVSPDVLVKIGDPAHVAALAVAAARSFIGLVVSIET